MASNFSFQPFGISTAITVTASLQTYSFSVVRSGGTTLTVGSTAGANYMPSNIRLANLGTVPIFITLGDSTVTTGLAAGIAVLGNTVEVFGTKGMSHMAMICGTTSTINITPGEGM